MINFLWKCPWLKDALLKVMPHSSMFGQCEDIKTQHPQSNGRLLWGLSQLQSALQGVLRPLPRLHYSPTSPSPNPASFPCRGVILRTHPDRPPHINRHLTVCLPALGLRRRSPQADLGLISHWLPPVYTHTHTDTHTERHTHAETHTHTHTQRHTRKHAVSQNKSVVKRS